MGYKQTYNPELRQTDHGRRLYQHWRTVKEETDDPTFELFAGFYYWAMANGYTVGAKLFRYDPYEPFSPDNCYWLSRDEWVASKKRVPEAKWGDKLFRYPEREKEWDDVVNRIRLHFGMEPIHSSEV